MTFIRFVEGEHEPIGVCASAEDEAVNRETLHELRDVIASLTEKQQLVIQLRFGFWDGKFYRLREIAALMGISNQAVSRIEDRALELLRARLKNVWIPTVSLENHEGL